MVEYRGKDDEGKCIGRRGKFSNIEQATDFIACTQTNVYVLCIHTYPEEKVRWSTMSLGMGMVLLCCLVLGDFTGGQMGTGERRITYQYHPHYTDYILLNISYRDTMMGNKIKNFFFFICGFEDM